MRQEDKQYKQLMCTFGDFMNNITNSFSNCTVYEAEPCTACEAEYDLPACLWVGNSKRCFAFFFVEPLLLQYVPTSSLWEAIHALVPFFWHDFPDLLSAHYRSPLIPHSHMTRNAVLFYEINALTVTVTTLFNSGAASSLISRSEVSVVTVTSADTSLQGIRVSKWSLSHMQAHSKHSSAHLRASLHSNQAPELLKEFHTMQDKQGWKFHTPSR